jgi:hypothetical protein
VLLRPDGGRVATRREKAADQRPLPQGRVASEPLTHPPTRLESYDGEHSLSERQEPGVPEHGPGLTDTEAVDDGVRGDEDAHQDGHGQCSGTDRGHVGPHRGEDHQPRDDDGN